MGRDMVRIEPSKIEDSEETLHLDGFKGRGSGPVHGNYNGT